MKGEVDLIDRIRRKLPSGLSRRRRTELLLGIGDDAALLRVLGGTTWAVSCDIALEGVHFISNVHTPEAVGYKALARATSDLAAMGARPRYFLLALTLPQRRTGRWLDRFLAGMAGAARNLGMVLAGGDTTRYATVAINITVLGEIVGGNALRRSGARPGDRIYVSGWPGTAQLGLEILLSRRRLPPKHKSLLRRHNHPEPRIALGLWLAKNRLATAAIDTSDGLSTDLYRLTAASGTGGRVWLERMPAVHIPAELRNGRFDPVALALHGGEDYELLFTVPPRLASRLPKSYRGVPIVEIGEITNDGKLCLVDAAGRTTRLVPGGWDPFRRRR